MTVETWDLITTVFVLVGWPVALVWEVALLYRRGLGGPSIPKTISMVLRDRAWHLNVMVYLWFGLGAHWFLPGPWWPTVWSGVTFWVVALALLPWDLMHWGQDPRSWPKWKKWARFPAVWTIVGMLSGAFLFPQKGLVPWA